MQKGVRDDEKFMPENRTRNAAWLLVLTIREDVEALQVLVQGICHIHVFPRSALHSDYRGRYHCACKWSINDFTMEISLSIPVQRGLASKAPAKAENTAIFQLCKN